MNGKNVLLIVIDALDATAVGCYGAGAEATPQLDALARSGALCENFYAAATPAHPAMASLLTARHAAGFARATRRDDLELPWDATLLPADYLRAGITTAAFANLRRERHWYSGYEFYIDAGLRHGRAASSHETNHLLLRWLRAHTQEPFLVNVHYRDLLRHPGAATVREIDASVGMVHSALRELRLHERTLLVVAGLYGTSLGQRLPLIAHGADVLSGTRVHGIVQTQDLGATLYEFGAASNVSVPANIDGVSFLSALQGRPAEGRKTAFAVQFGEQPVWSLRTAQIYAETDANGIVRGEEAAAAELHGWIEERQREITELEEMFA